MSNLDEFTTLVKNSNIDRSLEDRMEKKDRNLWDGFIEPNVKIDINGILLKIINMKENQKLEFVINHPFYRWKIQKVCKHLGFKYKSYINKNVKMNEDSALVLHLNCKRCTPLQKINWKFDLNSEGEYYQSISKCNYCKLITDEYIYVQGKNYVKIISPDVIEINPFSNEIINKNTFDYPSLYYSEKEFNGIYMNKRDLISLYPINNNIIITDKEESDIKLIMDNSSCTREVAIDSLIKNKNDIIDSIIYITG